MKKKNLEILARMIKAEKDLSSRNAAEALADFMQAEKKFAVIDEEIRNFQADPASPFTRSELNERYLRGSYIRKNQIAEQMRKQENKLEQAREELNDCIRDEKALDTVKGNLEKERKRLKQNHEENATEDFFRGRQGE